MTVATKRFRHGTDHPDFAAAIAVTITRRDFSAVGWPDGIEWPHGGDSFHEFFRGHHALGAPVVGISHVHELDEPQRMAASTEIFAESNHLTVVHAALNHAVDLYRETEGGRGINASQHAGDAEAETI